MDELEKQQIAEAAAADAREDKGKKAARKLWTRFGKAAAKAAVVTESTHNSDFARGFNARIQFLSNKEDSTNEELVLAKLATFGLNAIDIVATTLPDGEWKNPAENEFFVWTESHVFHGRPAGENFVLRTMPRNPTADAK